MPTQTEMLVQQLRREIAVRPIRVPGNVEVRKRIALFMWDWSGVEGEADESLCYLDGNDTPIAASYVYSATMGALMPGWYEYQLLDDGTAIAVGPPRLPGATVVEVGTILPDPTVERGNVAIGWAVYLGKDSWYARWGWVAIADPEGTHQRYAPVYDATEELWGVELQDVTANDPLMPVDPFAHQGPPDLVALENAYEVNQAWNRFTIAEKALADLRDVEFSPPAEDPEATYALVYDQDGQVWKPEDIGASGGGGGEITLDAGRSLAFSDGTGGPKNGDVTFGVIGNSVPGSLLITNATADPWIAGNFMPYWLEPAAAGADAGSVLQLVDIGAGVCLPVWLQDLVVGTSAAGGATFGFYYAAGLQFSLNSSGEVYLNCDNGNGVIIAPSAFGALMSKTVQLREEDVCVDGAWRKRLVLASEDYAP